MRPISIHGGSATGNSNASASEAIGTTGPVTPCKWRLCPSARRAVSGPLKPPRSILKRLRKTLPRGARRRSYSPLNVNGALIPMPSSRPPSALRVMPLADPVAVSRAGPTGASALAVRTHFDRRRARPDLGRAGLHPLGQAIDPQGHLPVEAAAPLDDDLGLGRALAKQAGHVRHERQAEIGDGFGDADTVDERRPAAIGEAVADAQHVAPVGGRREKESFLRRIQDRLAVALDGEARQQGRADGPRLDLQGPGPSWPRNPRRRTCPGSRMRPLAMPGTANASPWRNSGSVPWSSGKPSSVGPTTASFSVAGRLAPPRRNFTRAPVLPPAGKTWSMCGPAETVRR